MNGPQMPRFLRVAKHRAKTLLNRHIYHVPDQAQALPERKQRVWTTWNGTTGSARFKLLTWSKIL
jgi:hypothetical protein